MKLILITTICILTAINMKAADRYDFLQQDSINATSTVDTSNVKTPSNNYFGIGRGGSYGGLGLKFGKYRIVNDRYQATYLIGGVASYELNEKYSFGVFASVGRKFYFPKVLFIDTRVGINQYTFHGSKLLPAIGVKCLGGVEFRSNFLGISLGLGVSQNLLFDQATRPAIELGFIFGNF